MNFKKMFVSFVVFVVVLVLLVLLTPGCKTQSEPDDIQFVSLNARVVAQWDGFGEVDVTAVISVRTSTDTQVLGSIYLGSKERGSGVNISSTGGEWVTIIMPVAEFAPDSGTYEVRAEFTLMNTGKKVIGPPTTVTVK